MCYVTDMSSKRDFNISAKKLSQVEAAIASEKFPLLILE